MKKKQLLVLIGILFFLQACKKTEPIIITTENLHASVDKVTKIMIHDIFFTSSFQ